jgi:L-arabinokinase
MNPLMRTLRYYITGHGLGHASRSCQIINTLRRRHPQLAVQVVSDAHPWFFRGFLDPSVPVRRDRLDFGVLQHDSLVLREEETLRAYREFLPERERRVREETESLRREGVALVAADIPPAAFAAAFSAGIPAVGISNFSWDWIYEGLIAGRPGYEDILMSMREDYRCADLLLRLPFFGEFPAFRQIEDVPLVARRAVLSPEEVRQRLQIPPDKRLGLLSFGGFGLREFDFAALARLRGWIFLGEPELAGASENLRSIPPGCHYPDLVRAVDVVITKPGYGIVSEAIANRCPVLYTARGDFREQAVLVAALHRYGRAREIGNDKLRRGELAADLEALLAAPQPVESLPANGDEVVADRLAELMIGGGK